MKCEICGRGMPEGVNLHRQNEKGIKGIWRCDACNKLPIDPEAQEIMDWLYQGDRTETYGVFNTPPMQFRMGHKDTAVLLIGEPDGADVDQLPGSKGARNFTMSKDEFADVIRSAGRYAVRCATMNGKETDFDPDALIQNLVTGFLGYHTDTGLSSDDWENPKEKE